MRRAFTLLETVLGMCLLLFMLALAVLTPRSHSLAAQAESLAHNLANVLRECRAQAVRTGEPVAVAVPGPLAQGCYVLRGSSQARLQRVHNWSKESPRAALRGARYPGPTWLTRAPAQNALPLDLNGWAGTHAGAELVLFRPDGTVQTNLPWADGRAGWVSATGFGGSSGLSNPVAVTLTGAGEVEVERSLPGAAADVVQAGLGFDLTQVGALPRLSSTANRAPEFVGAAEWAPTPNELRPLVAPGADVTVLAGELLTLTVQGRDPDGDALSCEWSVEPPIGSFSASGPQPMRWNPTSGNWVGRCSWRAPADLSHSQVELRCRLRDEHGLASAPLQTSAGAPRVSILKPGRLIYIRGTDQALYTCNWEFTDHRKVLNVMASAGGFESPQWSPDGTRLGFRTAVGRFYTMNRDGSDLQMLLSGWNSGIWCWDPKGQAIYVGERLGTYPTIRTRVRRMVLDGATLSSPSSLPIVADLPAYQVSLDVHPNGHCLVLTDEAGVSRLVWHDAPTTPFSLGVRSELRFLPDGQRVMYSRLGGRVGIARLTLNDAAHSAVLTETHSLQLDSGLQHPQMSPDLQWIYSANYSYGYHYLLWRADGSQSARTVMEPYSHSFHWAPR